MKSLECVGLNISFGKLRGLVERLKNAFQKLRGVKVQFQKKLGSHGQPSFWPPIPLPLSVMGNLRKRAKGPLGLA